MFAWMNREALERTLDDRAHVVLEPEPQEFWCKGETSGDRQYVREAYYDCDMDVAPVRRRAGGARGVPHGRAELLLPRVRERRDTRSGVSARHAASRRSRSSSRWRATTRSCRCGARCSPTSRRRSRSSSKLVGEREGFLLESVEHAERWGRFSFLGRDPARTLVVRGREVEWLGGDPPDGVPSDQGALAALDALLAALPRADAARAPAVPRRHRRLARLRHGPRDRAAPERARRTTSGHADAVLSLAGQVAAFDHFRQRCYLIENVYPPPDADDARARRAVPTRPATASRSRGRRDRPPAAVPARAAARRRAHRAAGAPAQLHAETWAKAVEAAKEHILDGDIFQVVLAQRFDLVEAGRSRSRCTACCGS